MNDQNWALLPPEAADVEIAIREDLATIRNGRIEARVSEHGVLEFRNRRGDLLLREYVRRRDSDPPRNRGAGRIPVAAGREALRNSRHALG